MPLDEYPLPALGVAPWGSLRGPSIIPSMTVSPDIKFVIMRKHGKYVPLIPVDELPLQIRLQGVPRVMPLDQMAGRQDLGYVAPTGKLYELEQSLPSTNPFPTLGQTAGVASRAPSTMTVSPLPQPAFRFLAPDAHVRQPGAREEPKLSIPSPSPVPPVQPQADRRSVNGAQINAGKARRRRSQSDESQRDVVNSIIPPNSALDTRPSTLPLGLPRVAPPSGTEPDQSKKVYCTYWIRSGECDYMQQGCMYKHDMPDLATLNQIGFRTYPKWWTEKTIPKVNGSRYIGPAGVPTGPGTTWRRPGRGARIISIDTETDTTMKSNARKKASGNSRFAQSDRNDGGPAIEDAPTPQPQQPIEELLIDFGPSETPLQVVPPPPGPFQTYRTTTTAALNSSPSTASTMSRSTSTSPASIYSPQPNTYAMTPPTPAPDANPSTTSTTSAQTRVSIPNGEDTDYHKERARNSRARQHHAGGNGHGKGNAKANVLRPSKADRRRAAAAAETKRRGSVTNSHAGASTQGPAAPQTQAQPLVAVNETTIGAARDGTPRPPTMMGTPAGLMSSRHAVVATKAEAAGGN